MIRLVTFWVAFVWSINCAAAPVSPVTDSNQAVNKVAEGASIGTPMRITAQATDLGPGDTVSYSLSNDAGGLFAIEPDTGVVTVNGALDDDPA